MKKKVYDKEITFYIMLDLSNHPVDIIVNDYRKKIINHNIQNKTSHFTFMTIIFNKKYKSIKKFLKNKYHINIIKKILKLYFINCIFEPNDYEIYGDEKKFYVKEYEINKKCKKKITFVRKLIYNYIALHLIYKKHIANKLFKKYIKNYKNDESKISCTNIKNKINKKFISFIYKKNDKKYDLFSIPIFNMEKDKLNFHISIMDDLEIKNKNEKLYYKLLKYNDVNKEKMKYILMNKTQTLNIKWPKIIVDNKLNYFINYF